MWRVRSFRVRVALLSAALSGLVLVAFSLWAWALAQRTALERIDMTLREIAQQNLRFPRGEEHWAYVGQSLEYVFGEQNDVLLRVDDPQGNALHLSASWPENLPETGMPRPGPFGASPEGMPTPDPRPRGPRRGEGPPPPPPGDAGNGLFAPGPPDGDQGRPPPPEWGQGWDPRRGPLRGEAPGQRGDFGAPYMGGRPGPGGRGPGPGGPPPFPAAASERPLQLRQPRFAFATDGVTTWRMGVFGNPGVTVYIGIGISAYAAEVGRVRTAFLIALPTALLCIALGSWLLASRALRPVQRLTQTIARVSAQGLDQRAAPGQEDREFDELLHVFNAMMDRLERSFFQAIRFSADAAHELKTPLTVLQGELEQALQHAPPDQQATFGKLVEEVQRLKAITQKLLLLARADAGQLHLHLSPVDLTAMLEEIVEDARILAPELQIDTRIEEGVVAPADLHLLRQAIQNIATNAVKYTPSAGRVRFHLVRRNGYVRCTVQNTGEISAQDHARIFTRFYRVDQSRTRQEGEDHHVEGSGLGLSLAREIVRAHGGELTLDKSPGSVVSFSLRLPVKTSPDLT